jgi:YD repeat-containing protein
MRHDKDAFGNLVEVREYLDNHEYRTKYSYNSQDKLIGLEDAMGNKRDWTYDSLGRQLLATELYKT